jgi:hypothetical protein
MWNGLNWLRIMSYGGEAVMLNFRLDWAAKFIRVLLVRIRLEPSLHDKQIYKRIVHQVSGSKYSYVAHLHYNRTFPPADS